MTLLKTKNEAKGGYIQKRTLGKGQHTNSNRQARQSSRGLLAIKRGGGAWDPDSRTGTAVAKGVLDRGKTREQAIATASETKSQTLAGKADGMDVLLGNVESQYRHSAQLNTHADADCERIGSLRRECLDWFLVLNETFG